MSTYDKPAWHHSDRYGAQSACKYCEGNIRHQRWCLTINSAVYYAYQIIVDPNKLTIGDAILLHALDVLWSPSTQVDTVGEISHDVSSELRKGGGACWGWKDTAPIVAEPLEIDRAGNGNILQMTSR